MSSDNAMSAAYYEGSGVFSVRAGDVRPPAAGEVRLEVAYCGVCGTDLHIAHGAMDARVRPPQVIGHEMSGTVAELGEGVEGFQSRRRGGRAATRPAWQRRRTGA